MGIEVQKSPYPLLVSRSTQEIYLTTNPEMGAGPADAGGVRFGGLVGNTVVAPFGADHRYQSPLLITLHEPSRP